MIYKALLSFPLAAVQITSRNKTLQRIALFCKPFSMQIFGDAIDCAPVERNLVSWIDDLIEILRFWYESESFADEKILFYNVLTENYIQILQFSFIELIL